MDIQIITAPLIGGVIGLLTNGLAIKMMFKPLKPVYIGKFRLPFTPGIIPKEKERIAKAVGRAVGNNILDNDTIKNTLLSENIHEKLMEKITEIIDEYKSSESTIGEFLEQKNYLEPADKLEQECSEKIAEHIRKKLVEADIGNVLVETAFNDISTKLNPMIMALAGNAINSAKTSVAEKINEMADEKAGVMISEYISHEYEAIKERPIGETVSAIDEKYPDIKNKIWDIYCEFVEKKSTSLLQTFNVAEVVEQKIIDYDLESLEKLILSIIDKELHAIIYLGGILGVIMGFLNLLF